MSPNKSEALMQIPFSRVQAMPATLLFTLVLEVNTTRVYPDKGALFPFLNIPFPYPLQFCSRGCSRVNQHSFKSSEQYTQSINSPKLVNSKLDLKFLVLIISLVSWFSTEILLSTFSSPSDFLSPGATVNKYPVYYGYNCCNHLVSPFSFVSVCYLTVWHFAINNSPWNEKETKRRHHQYK